MSQPPPTPGREDVYPVLLSRLADRYKSGLKTYGVPLQSHNGRDALEDALEEALDLAMYLQQAIMERAKRDEENRQLTKLAFPIDDHEQHRAEFAAYFSSPCGDCKGPSSILRDGKFYCKGCFVEDYY